MIVVMALAVCMFCQAGCSPGGLQQHLAPTTAPAVQPAIKPIDVQYDIYLARLSAHVTITPDGLLRSVRTENKRHGANDKSVERTEIRQGKLTPEQIVELTQFFAGWRTLSDKPYGGVPDGGHIAIRYGDKTVSGGSDTPKQVWDVYRRIKELARSMPRIEP